MPLTLDQLAAEVSALKERNQRVEQDKAWETSLTRRLLLILFTYLAVSLYFLYLGVINPWANAVVPALGFLLSTLTLPFFKRLWIKLNKK